MSAHSPEKPVAQEKYRMNAQTSSRDIACSPVADLSQLSVRTTVLLTIATIAAILIIYHETTWSMVSIWARSDTFAHGFLIFPFSAYLIWTQHKRLSMLSTKPNPLALAVLAGLGFSWLLATFASVQVVAQFLLIFMIPAAVWAMLGNRIVLALAFPLAYLMLAVPFGESFIAPLIDFTANFTVTALQWSGIPVYREGSFFTIPTGSWSVVEACSGLRYLIASFTLGTLYAYLTYRSLTRRLIFIFLSVIVPIIANGIRAYLIVMTGHLSDMQLAVGIDHLIYGLLFFGFVMVLLFWFGSFWREDDERSGNDNLGTSLKQASRSVTRSPVSLRRMIFSSVSVMVIALIWPVYAYHVESEPPDVAMPELRVADIPGKWQYDSAPASDWHPAYVGATAQLLQSFRSGERSVDLYISYYRNQQQGTELINSENTLVPERGTKWYNVKQDTRNIPIGSRQQAISQNQLRSPSRKLLVWRWYWVGGEETINPYLAKFILARNKLLGRSDEGAEIVIASRYEETPDEAVPVLQRFLEDMMPAIADGLQNAGDS